MLRPTQVERTSDYYDIVQREAEVAVGRTGNFLGILSKAIPSSFATVGVGAFYSLAGFSLLTMKKWGAVLGILFLSAENPRTNISCPERHCPI